MVGKASFVSLFTREWIEIYYCNSWKAADAVSLFTREWIEINACPLCTNKRTVSLFTREWIEIPRIADRSANFPCLPLYEGVD